MTDLSTIATAIEIGLERGMTGEQAINLLRQIRDQIRAEQSHEPGQYYDYENTRPEDLP